MHNGKVGMLENHSGSGEAHYFFYFFPHIGFVTVNLAFTANGLFISEWTILQSFISIIV